MVQHNRFVLLISISVMALSVLGCSLGGLVFESGPTETVRGSGNVVEQVRDVSGFTGVELATVGEMIIELGDEDGLRIEAEDNLIDYFRSEVRGRTLVIDIPFNVSIRPTHRITYYVTVKELDAIEVSSSGDIQAPDLEAGRFSVTVRSSGDVIMGDLEADRLDVSIFSSGDVEVGDLYAEVLDVDISSSGSLDIAGGQVERQEITISSSGDYTGPGVESVEADVRISSSGSATIRVSESLQATISSSGDVYYIGSPAVEQTTTSSGDVVQIGE